ncbi:MAG: alpha/beta fold hydrolase [Proteobacteria bacterium]|nr:alpha/beta fold hydrolase [Pseudomonadota bacterium]
MRSALLLLILAGVAGCQPTVGDPGPGVQSDARVGDGAPVVPPVPSGCVTDVTTGDHTYTCGGLVVDARIPAACQAPGCGLILVLHGDTGNGLLMDAHVKLRELGAQRGFVVIAPTGPAFGQGYPGSTWHAEDDLLLMNMVAKFRDVFRIDPARIHVTGFSRGGFVTWRLLCDHADVFASAAPAGAGDGAGFGEVTCFANGRAPSRHIPIAFLVGRTDTSVGYQPMLQIRDAAIASYGAGPPAVIGGDATFTHQRWTANDSVIETFEHGYETVADGPWADAHGHCIPGSTSDPYGVQYAIPCKLPNAFVWGQAVIDFFVAHPMP